MAFSIDDRKGCFDGFERIAHARKNRPFLAQSLVKPNLRFDISAEFLPDLLRQPDAQLRSLSEERPAESASFEDVQYRSDGMARLVEKARRVAVRNIPVLLEGESGTGKELFARAIHKHSPRKAAPFVAVNCGAIPPNLVEAELFGHEKGAFTGAQSRREGHFESADKGTLFLDEIGELPQDVQVRLLRVLEEREVVRIGSSKPIAVDVRIIAATNRNLIEEVGAGRFREDLFYRLVVAYLNLPPLRDRTGDLGLLIDYALAQINRSVDNDSMRVAWTVVDRLRARADQPGKL